MTKTMTLYHFVGLPVFNTFEVKEYTVTNQVKYFETVEWFQRFATKKENVVHNEMGRIEVFTTDAGMLEVLRKRFTSRLNREHSKLVAEEGVKQAEQVETTQAVEEEEAGETDVVANVKTVSVYGREFTIEVQAEAIVVSWGRVSKATLSIENGRVNTSDMFYLMGADMTRRSRTILAKKINEFMIALKEAVQAVEETAVTTEEEIEMTTESHESNLCPTCGEKELYPEGPRNALSRIDNKTQICVQCGTEEALAPVMNMPLEFKRDGRYELARKVMDELAESEGTPDEKISKLALLEMRLEATYLFGRSWLVRNLLETQDKIREGVE